MCFLNLFRWKFIACDKVIPLASMIQSKNAVFMSLFVVCRQNFIYRVVVSSCNRCWRKRNYSIFYQSRFYILFGPAFSFPIIALTTWHSERIFVCINFHFIMRRYHIKLNKLFRGKYDFGNILLLLILL